MCILLESAQHLWCNKDELNLIVLEKIHGLFKLTHLFIVLFCLQDKRWRQINTIKIHVDHNWPFSVDDQKVQKAPY